VKKSLGNRSWIALHSIQATVLPSSRGSPLMGRDCFALTRVLLL
jgi:hypothetical protein